MENVLTITLHRAKKAALNSLKAGLVPFLHSSPGLGKSAIIKEIAKELQLKIIDVRLAQVDPTELNGYPMFSEHVRKEGVIQKASYVPMDTFPIEGDALPEDYNGWILFMDELSSAPPAVQAAAYKIILDNLVGAHKLHKNCLIAAAGNLLTDNAVVEEMSTALQSRMSHYVIEPNLEEFVKWGASAGISETVMGFLNYQPHLLHHFSPDHNDLTFPCPRTWEFCSDMVKIIGTPTHEHLPEIASCVGEGAARDFITYCQVYNKLPSFAEIMANPTGFNVDNSPSIKWATTMMISFNLDDKNSISCLEALDHIGAEFAFVGMKTICGRIGSKVVSIPGMSKFFSKYGMDYLI